MISALSVNNLLSDIILFLNFYYKNRHLRINFYKTMEHEPRVTLNVFEGKSTYLNDYRRVTPEKRYKYTWPGDCSEQPARKQKEFIRKDPETLFSWKKNVHIPFDLMMEPRPIIDTHPKDIVPRCEEPIDKDKEKVMKTRPRLYVSPAVSVDDIPDKETRDLLCRYMYNKKSIREWEVKTNTKEIATSTLEVGRNPVKLVTEVYPPLPLGWREKGKKWDHYQRRYLVDPTETFWINKAESVKCGACVNPFKGVVPKEVKDELTDLIQKDKLRLSHDYPTPSYAGLKPVTPQSIPLAKKDAPVVHPSLTISQAIAQRYKDDEQN